MEITHTLFLGILCMIGFLCLISLWSIREHGVRVWTKAEDDPRWPEPTPPDMSPSQREPIHTDTIFEKAWKPEPMVRIPTEREGAVAPDQLLKPHVTREQMAQLREQSKMGAATFNYGDPPEWMLHHPLYEPVWDEIKTWDINVPTEYTGCMGATGNHVAAILYAIMNHFNMDNVNWAQRATLAKEQAANAGKARNAAPRGEL